MTTDNFSDILFINLFPNIAVETPGAPGKVWVKGEVNQINNVVTWKLNNVVVAERTNTSSFTSGDIMLGYMDIFSSIASPLTDNYVIFDNVKVLVVGVAPAIVGQPQMM